MTPPRRIVFHLGFQKTGTTSVQEMLNQNRDRLAGIDLRAYGFATKDLRVAGRSFCADPTPQRETRLRKALDDHIARFRDGDAPVGLISDENILGRVLFGPTGDVIAWGQRILPMIEHAATGFDAHFVFYTRAQAPWRQSIYKQSVKRARETRDFAGWAAAAPFDGDWPDWPAWQAALQSCTSVPVTFLSMEQELQQDPILGAGLLRLLGVGDDVIRVLDPVNPQNTALSDRALGLMRVMNRLPLGDKRLIRISEYIEAQDRKRQAR